MISNENYLTTNEISKIYNISTKHTCNKIKDLYDNNKIKAKKVKMNGVSPQWLVLQSDVEKYFKIKSKKTEMTKKQTIINIYENLKKQNVQVMPRDIKNELDKLNMSATAPYIHTIISSLGYKPNSNHHLAHRKETEVHADNIKNAVDFIKNLPENYDPIQILGIAEKLLNQFGTIQKAKDNIEIVYNIKNSF
jgi:hypothetical protein